MEMDNYYDKVSQKILTKAGPVSIQRTQINNIDSVKLEINYSTDKLFESSNSHLWSMIYILTFSDTIAAFIQDEDSGKIFRCPTMDVRTDKLFNLLRQENWGQGKLFVDSKPIEYLINSR
jgi:hypothetical protein